MKRAVLVLGILLAGCGSAAKITSISMQSCLEHEGYNVAVGFNAESAAGFSSYRDLFNSLTGTPSKSGYRTGILAGGAFVGFFRTPTEAEKAAHATQSTANGSEGNTVQIGSKADVAWFATTNAAEVSQKISGCA